MTTPVPITQPMTASVRAVADALADLTAALRNLLDDQAETPTDPTPTAPHGMASPAAPTVALPIGQPVDLDTLGLGAVVRARQQGDANSTWTRDARLWLRVLDGIWLPANGEPYWLAPRELADVEVLHPGITLAGEDE